MLEGRYEFILGGERAIHGPRAFVYIPKGVPHGFRNAGDTVARMLIVNLPDGLHEAFFAEAGARYGIALLPPA